MKKRIFVLCTSLALATSLTGCFAPTVPETEEVGVEENEVSGSGMGGEASTKNGVNFSCEQVTEELVSGQPYKFRFVIEGLPDFDTNKLPMEISDLDQELARLFSDSESPDGGLESVSASALEGNPEADVSDITAPQVTKLAPGDKLEILVSGTVPPDIAKDSTGMFMPGLVEAQTKQENEMGSFALGIGSLAISCDIKGNPTPTELEETKTKITPELGEGAVTEQKNGIAVAVEEPMQEFRRGQEYVFKAYVEGTDAMGNNVTDVDITGLETTLSVIFDSDTDKTGGLTSVDVEVLAGDININDTDPLHPVLNDFSRGDAAIIEIHGIVPDDVVVGEENDWVLPLGGTSIDIGGTVVG